jgi:hypothetical protein
MSLAVNASASDLVSIPLSSHRHAILCVREIDMSRWEALFGIVNGAILFVPVFVAIFASNLTSKQGRDERERRIVAYRKSPESQLLRLNY